MGFTPQPPQPETPQPVWLDALAGPQQGEPRRSDKPRDSQRGEIEKSIAALFRDLNQVVELRIPKAGKYRTISGYFDDVEKLADAIEEWSGQNGVEGVYCTLNPVVPALLARSSNRAKEYAQHTTSDKDIARRAWLLIDLDPCRPSGVSSSNAEKKLASGKAKAIRAHLRALDWPEPLAADSGNGYHLLYSIDLPNDDHSANLVKSCLDTLSAKFDDDAVKIDTTVFNAARIVKAYGSLAAKGDSTAERPHRVARLLKTELPGGKEIATQAQLEALAAEAPSTAANQYQNSGSVQGQVTPDKMEEFLRAYHVGHKPRSSYSGGYKWILDECPFQSDHKGSSIAVLLRRDGLLCFECKHASCQRFHWKDFREELETRHGHKFRFFETKYLKQEETAGHANTKESATVVVAGSDTTTEVIKPLGDTALYGLLGEFVNRQLPETEADVPGLLFQALALTGNFLGPIPHFRVRATKHRTNLYVCLVGPTSCGKGEGKDCVDSLLLAARSDWHGVSGLTSGEGIAAVAKDEENPEEIKTICFDETEFARLLEASYRSGNTIGPMLRLGWDKVEFQVVNKNSPINAKAMISLVGHITPRELLTTLAEKDLSNGFANRILWVRVRSSKDIPDAGMEFKWEDLALRLNQAKKLVGGSGEMNFDDEARDLWQSVYGQLKNRPDDVFGKVTARARPNVKRMAMIYSLLPPVNHSQILDTELARIRANKIGIAPLRAALEAWRYAEDSARLTFQQGMEQTKATDDVTRCRLEANKNGGKLTGSQLCRLFSHKTAEQRITIATRAGLKFRSCTEGKRGSPEGLWTW